MHDPYKALYIHIPFCKKRCRYCDFQTSAVKLDNPVVREYVDRLILDIRRAGKAGHLGELESVYVGGGTPSFLGQKYLTEIFYTLGLSMMLTDQVECSMEANPDSLSAPMVKDLWALGVNRLSIGVQSFDEEVLSILGRVHDAQAAKEAIETAQTRFENVSVDLMCGIPGQSTESFRSSLQTAVDAGVTHISVYPLTIEENTQFDIMVQAKELPEPDDDVEAESMKLANEVLSAAGFERYEVASYAKPGFECKHNEAYWTGKPYLGLGSSAVTMTQNAERRMRVRDEQVQDDLDAKQMVAEDAMLGMRLVRGIDDSQVRTWAQLVPELPTELEKLTGDGLVTHADGRWRPTERGWLCGNELYGRILDLAP